MQQLLNVITPAESQDLVSLEDMKQKMAITNTATDFMLQEIITTTSEAVAKLCNRVFGYEGVDETFYQLEDDSSRRLYLSRWPVVKDDITALTQDGVDISTGLGSTFFLEEVTGTLYMPPMSPPWYGVIDVQYSGGYALPDDAPASLAFCAEALIREGYMSWIRSPASFGVRQISHKEARIGYYGPNMFPTLGLPATWAQVQAILAKYVRQWV